MTLVIMALWWRGICVLPGWGIFADPLLGFTSFYPTYIAPLSQTPGVRFTGPRVFIGNGKEMGKPN